jgi:hypothetical protein
MEPAAVNVFEPPDSADDLDAIRRQIAAHAVCEMKVTDIDDLDGVVERVFKVLQNRPKDTDEILESRKSGTVPRLHLSVQSILDNNSNAYDAARPGAMTRQRLQEQFQTAMQAGKSVYDTRGPRNVYYDKSHTPLGTADKAKAELGNIALCGALWHSGLISTILSVLGWTVVDKKIKQIQTGALVDLADKAKLVDRELITTQKTNKVSMQKKLKSYARQRNTQFGAYNTALNSGAGVADTVQQDFSKDQRAIALGNKCVNGAEHKAGFGPAFLEAHIHEVAKAQLTTLKTKPDAEREVKKFALVSYASACVLHVAAKHIAECMPRTENTVTEIDDGTKLATHIVRFLRNHTAVPNGTYGVFQWLHGHLCTHTKDVGLTGAAGGGAPPAPAAEYTDAKMRDLVASLAAFERNGIRNGSNASNGGGFSWFATPILPSQQQEDRDKAKKLKHVFDLYMPDYEDAAGDKITNPDLADKDDLIEAFTAMQSDLDGAGVTALAGTNGDKGLKGNGETPDKFETRLEERVKEIVESTWNAVTDSKYDTVVVRARASVFAAHDTAKMHTSASLKNEQRIYIKELAKSDLDVNTHIVDIACAALEPNSGTTTDVTTHAVAREAEATLRRNILQDFANAAIAKNRQSFPTFLAMMRQLAKMQYEWRDDTYAAKVGKGPITTASGSKTQAELEALAGVGYFAVAKADIKEWELLEADQFTKDALSEPSGDDHVYARLPSTLVEQSQKGAMLKIDVLDALSKTRKDPNDARALADLGAKHSDAKTLLGVTLAAVRNGRTVPSRGNLSYAVVFRLNDVWHMFVHVNADPTLLTTFQSRAAADAMKPKIQSSVKALVQKAYYHAKKSKPFKRVVFRNDEWSGLISGVRVPKLDGETKALTELRGDYEKDDLVLHVWRDMEFVPAPFAFATPMFR